MVDNILKQDLTNFTTTMVLETIQIVYKGRIDTAIIYISHAGYS